MNYLIAEVHRAAHVRDVREFRRPPHITEVQRKLTIIGIVFSVAYPTAIVVWRWSDLLTIGNCPLNELGDFLAGVVGPLAILWLVLGFLQQGEELRQNTRALQMQADELKRSVEQHKELVETEKAVLELQSRKSIRDRQPNFTIAQSGLSCRNVSTRIGTYGITIKNEGAHASNVALDFIPTIQPNYPDQIGIDTIPSGAERTLWWSLPEADAPHRILVVIRALDLDGRSFLQAFQLTLKDAEWYIVTSQTGAG